jgi:hypothetical protein
MASSNYPFNQDTAFNSFTITDPTIVQSVFGRTYAQSELVPVNYPRLFTKSLTDVSITWFPVQEFVYISDAQLLIKFQSESTSDLQGFILKQAFTSLYNYWKEQLMLNSAPAWATALNAPMIVVTPRAPLTFQDNGTGDIHLTLIFDIVTFVVPTSIYA